MCLLSFYPPGSEPVERDLGIACKNNPDGFGYAIVTRHGNLLIRRSMEGEYLLERFIADRRKHPHGAALFHARIGTSGRRNLDNCHPFKVGRDNQTVLAHNGILFRPPYADPRSDTHIFAEEVMPSDFRVPDRPSVRRRLEIALGPGNKVVLLTTNRRYRHPWYIFNENYGHWTEDHIWYSNRSYAELRPKATSYYVSACPSGRPAAGKTPAGGDSTYWYCQYCKHVKCVSPLTRICTICHVCAECGEWRRVCECPVYIPATGALL